MSACVTRLSFFLTLQPVKCFTEMSILSNCRQTLLKCGFAEEFMLENY